MTDSIKPGDKFILKQDFPKIDYVAPHVLHEGDVLTASDPPVVYEEGKAYLNWSLRFGQDFMTQLHLVPMELVDRTPRDAREFNSLA